MTARKRAIWFFVRLTVLYALFAFPWQPVEAGYSRVFAMCADGLTWGCWGQSGIFGSDALIRVYAGFDEDAERDINIVAGNKSTGAGTDKIRTSSRHLGYMPAVVLIALILATPIPWTRKLWAVLWGLLWVHLFVLLRFALLVVMIFHGDNPYSLFHWPPPWDTVLDEGTNILTVVPATEYVVPLILWMAVTFRREDLEPLLGRFQPPSDAASSP